MFYILIQECNYCNDKYEIVEYFKTIKDVMDYDKDIWGEYTGEIADFIPYEKVMKKVTYVSREYHIDVNCFFKHNWIRIPNEDEYIGPFIMPLNMIYSLERLSSSFRYISTNPLMIHPTIFKMRIWERYQNAKVNYHTKLGIIKMYDDFAFATKNGVLY